MTKKTWKLKAKDGRTVIVKYNSHSFGGDDVCCHLEFRGYATSETGYHSHFFGAVGDGVVEPPIEDVLKLAKDLMIEFYTPPKSLNLFI